MYMARFIRAQSLVSSNILQRNLKGAGLGSVKALAPRLLNDTAVFTLNAAAGVISSFARPRSVTQCSWSNQYRQRSAPAPLLPALLGEVQQRRDLLQPTQSVFQT